MLSAAVARLLEMKKDIRLQAAANRQRQQGKEELSRQICERLASLGEFVDAQRLLVYVGRPIEVQTGPLFNAARSRGKQVVVPCCVGRELELFRVDSLDELSPRTLGILEPGDEIRTQASRRAALGELHLIVVPGVAFDPRGGRVGHGRGYYDRLLRRARSETPVVGLGFECQIFAEVPMLDHDVFVDKVITEKRIYTRGERGRRGQAALV